MEELRRIVDAIFSQTVLLTILASFVLFFVVAPLFGKLFHRLMRRVLPGDDIVVVLASGLIVFLLSFAVFTGLLLNSGLAVSIELGPTLLISALLALVVTVLSAYFLKRSLDRAAAKIDPDQHVFSVWDEDQRKRPRDFRRR